MEINWAQRQLDGYARDAERVLACFLAGERDPAFLARALDLLRTYLQSRHSTAFPNSPPHAADAAVVKLATILNQHLQDLGFWHQIVALWPALIEMAKSLPDPLLYVESVNQLAIIKDRQGHVQEAQALFERIIGAPTFEHLPPIKRANTLIMAGSCYLWHGDHARAEQLLSACLAICRCSGSEHSLLPTTLVAPVDQFGVHASGMPHPLWQIEGFTLKQLGNLAMFRGDFARAHRCFGQCLALFEANGEGDNLACVAHQAIGRLLLYERRFVEASIMLERGLAIRRRRREGEHVAANSIYLAAAHLGRGQLASAETLLTDALPHSRALENRHDVALCHLYLGQLAALRNQRDEHRLHWQEALHVMQTTSIPVVELQVWVRRLPWLWRRGEVGLCGAVGKRLLINVREQRLSGLTICRLLRYACGDATSSDVSH